MASFLCKMSNVTHVSDCSRCVSCFQVTVSCMHESATSKKTSSHVSIRRTKRKVRNHMRCYRVALRGNHSAIWRWKTPPFNSLHRVLGILSLCRTRPEEHISVFLFTSTQHMDVMLQRANQGGLSRDIDVKQLVRCPPHELDGGQATGEAAILPVEFFAPEHVPRSRNTASLSLESGV
jgi:hypothetical protein